MRNNLHKFISTTALASGLFAVDTSVDSICGAYDPNDPADKEVVDGLIEAAVEAERESHAAEIERLKKDNAKTREKLRQARAGGDGADTGEIERLEKELEETQTKLATAETGLREANRTLKRVEGERDTAVKSLETESSFSRNMLVENGLTAALAEANVAPQFMEAAKALLMQKGVSVKVDGDNRMAVGPNDKPLGEFVKEWAGSDNGKHYIAAPANAGGGANGGTQGGAPAKKISEMTLPERTAHYNAVGQAAFDAQVESENKAAQQPKAA